jgi:hypothetical protein
LQADRSAGTLEDQIKDGFLAGLNFEDNSQDRVKVFTQKSEADEWERFSALEYTPKAALSLMVNLWNQGYGLKVEIQQVLTGDWDTN